MKHTICIFLFTIIIIVVSLVSCQNKNTINSNSETSTQKEHQIANNCKLRVNGTDVSSEFAIINYQERYAEIPFTLIIKKLGGEIKWKNESKVLIYINDTIYILNPLKNTLYEKGNSINLLMIPPGTKHKIYSKISEDEFIIDSDSISYFLNLLNAKILINYDDNIIELQQKTD